MVATKKRGKRGANPEKEAGYVIIESKVELPQAVRHPTPEGCIGAALHPCEACGGKWNVKDREEVDGKIVPAEHRTFFRVQLVEMPKYTSYVDPWTDKLTLDIWCPVHGGVLPIVTRRWLCPTCYEAEWNADVARWCQEQRDDALRSRMGETMDAAMAMFKPSLPGEEDLTEEFDVLIDDPIRREKFWFMYTKFAVEGVAEIIASSLLNQKRRIARVIDP